MNATKPARNSEFKATLSGIIDYIRREDGLVHHGTKIKTFPVFSPYYGKWHQVASVVVSPTKETINPNILNYMLQKLMRKMPPTSDKPSYVHKYAGKVGVGNVTFNEEIGRIEIARGAAATVSLSENVFTPGMPINGFLTWDGENVVNFKDANKASIQAPETTESTPMHRLITLYLFPTRITALEAFSNIIPPYNAVIDLNTCPIVIWNASRAKLKAESEEPNTNRRRSVTSPPATQPQPPQAEFR